MVKKMFNFNYFRCFKKWFCKISLYSYYKLLSVHLKSESVIAEIWSYLVGSRTFKTQSNSGVGLPRIHNVAASMR